MQISVAVYQRKSEGMLTWVTVGLGAHTQHKTGRSVLKLRRRMSTDLERLVAKLHPEQLMDFQLRPGVRLERVRMELTLRGSKGRRRVSGVYPLVVEPRWFNQETRVEIAYHPLHQGAWLPIDPALGLGDQAATYFQRAWAELDDWRLDELRNPEGAERKDSLRVLAFNGRPRSVIDTLDRKRKSVWEDLETDKDTKKRDATPGSRALVVLPEVGVDMTARVLGDGVPLGVPRQPYRAQLQQWLGARKRQPVVLVGPPGVGKSTLLVRWIGDLSDAEDYPSHRNLTRIHHVWRISGKRLIAGMSYRGQWEQRCLELVEEVKANKVVLWVEDLADWTRLGRSRQSARCLADVFQGPLSRGELVVVGECRPEAWQRLEDEAPMLAALLTPLHVRPTGPGETLQMMLQVARGLEPAYHMVFQPMAYRAVLELGGALFPGQALPGKALDMLRQIARDSGLDEASDGDEDGRALIDAEDVTRLLARRTGIPDVLLEPDQPLDMREVRRWFERHVMGQPEAIDAVCDQVAQIKAGLTHPQHPYGVMLFTGPTGVGKTELSKALARFLYGSAKRMIRLDMSEFAHSDAAARLIGDRWQPDGALTRQVQEQPFSVVLLDEIEKAHPSALNLLLQVFDEGRLTDAAGRVADFSHAVVILTSNLGGQTQAPVGFGDEASRSDGVMHDVAKAVQRFFSPELFNRIGRVVPFRPLSREVAQQIVAKELRRLWRRRGLVERHIFVRVNPSVIDLIVDNAFDPRDGARSVKRYLEDRLGALLTEHITASGEAIMRHVWMYRRDDALDLHVEPMVEADGEGLELALEPLIDARAETLQALIPEALDAIEALLETPQVAALSKRIRGHLELLNQGDRGHADPVFYLDMMRHKLRDFAFEAEAMLGLSAEELLAIEQMRHQRVEPPQFDPRNTRRNRRRAVMAPQGITSGMGQATRAELLEMLAEVHALRRAVRLVDAMDQHAVWVELIRIGQDPSEDAAWGSRSAGLMAWMIRAYVEGRGEVEQAAWRDEEGRVQMQRGGEKLVAAALDRAPSHAVLAISGLCIRDVFEGEHGCHVWRGVGAHPEVVRVRVIPNPEGTPPDRLLRDHHVALTRFQEALEQDNTEALPPNPEGLAPIVRRITFDPPRTPGATAPMEVEDYKLGTSMTLQARDLAGVVRSLWQLRLSQVEGGSGATTDTHSDAHDNDNDNNDEEVEA